MNEAVPKNNWRFVQLFYIKFVFQFFISGMIVEYFACMEMKPPNSATITIQTAALLNQQLKL